MYDGSDIVKIAMKHRGERYVLGAKAPLANAGWTGPWDCAEFVSWCAYQAYRIIYAVRPPDPSKGESYSGWWYDDAYKVGNAISVADAIATAGAVLVRKPRSSPSLPIGHVSISCGDGTTIEAKDRATGVAVIKNAASRSWQVGVLLPGVAYSGPKKAASYKEPAGYFYLDSPFMRGAKVTKIQKALSGKGLSPGPVDGYFGNLTAAAVRSFQAQEGLVPDGVVGPETAAALGLGWPI